MQSENLLTETNAAELSGVSIATLNRFAEVGYLRTETGTDGRKLFSKDELLQIFRLAETENSQFAASESTSDSSALNAKIEVERPAAVTNSKAFESETLEDGNDILDPIDQDEVFQSDTEVNAEPLLAATNSSPQGAVPNSVEQETLNIHSLRSIIELQEKVLELREAEIASLKEDRTWLRARIEKLESQSDRDRVIVLSNMQAMKRLIGLQERKKSSVRATLEFFGLVAPEKPTSDMSLIELPNE